jgi:hypothetical protein
MATKKKKATSKPTTARGPKPLRDMKKTHAKTLIGKVNSMLADQGFAARVNELHLVPSGGDSLSCDDCQPPNVCKRVCFINNQGQPECEDRCVGPDN